MEMQTEPVIIAPDPAAIFASALSLWQTCKQQTTGKDSMNLSECYNGMDQFMREVMRVADYFEAWACLHINFDEMAEVWPYLLKDNFGEACLGVILPSALAEFDDTDCLRVAIRLRLPIKFEDKLPIPICVTARNPVQGSLFREFQIHTVRDSIEDDSSCQYTTDDDPFDENFGVPYFCLYGVGDDGLLEHIADRRRYSEAVSLAQKLAPGVGFQTASTFSNHHRRPTL